MLVERCDTPRRRLPQRRLHPVEGAAPRRQGDRRDQGDGRARAVASARRRSTSTALVGWKDGVVGKLAGGLAGLAKQRKVEDVCGAGRFVSPHRCRSASAELSFDHCIVAAGSEPVRLPVPARRPARARLDLRARARDDPGAAAGDRRRDHRAGDGDGLRRAGLEGDGRGAARRSCIPGRDPDLVKPLREADRGPLRGRSARAVEVASVDGAARPGSTVEFDRAPRDERSTPCSSRSGACRTATGARGGRGRRRGRASAASIPVDAAAAHERPAIYAIGDIVGQADARPQGAARGPGGGRGRSPARRSAVRRRARSRRSPTPIPRWRGSG